MATLHVASPAAATTNDLFGMANLYPRTTGLPMTVWVSPRGGPRHDARIKVSRSGGDRMVPEDAAIVGIRPQAALIEGAPGPREFDLVARWVGSNRAALIAYWDGRIDTIQLGMRLVRA